MNLNETYKKIGRGDTLNKSTTTIDKTKNMAINQGIWMLLGFFLAKFSIYYFIGAWFGMFISKFMTIYKHKKLGRYLQIFTVERKNNQDNIISVGFAK